MFDFLKINLQVVFQNSSTTTLHSYHQCMRIQLTPHSQQLLVFSVFFFFLIFIVIQLQLSAFSTHPSTPLQPNPPPSPTSTLPIDFVHVSFIVAPVQS